MASRVWGDLGPERLIPASGLRKPRRLSRKQQNLKDIDDTLAFYVARNNAADKVAIDVFLDKRLEAMRATDG